MTEIKQAEREAMARKVLAEQPAYMGQAEVISAMLAFSDRERATPDTPSKGERESGEALEAIEAAIHKRFPNADAQTVIALARDIVRQALGESAS